MGETTAASNAALQVSVSFGRFEGDSLSWEKWSSFSPNKYMEEVEKCAAPGSVAMKRAYFEAHYKKIAAQKAELLDEEKRMMDDSLRTGENNGDLNRDDDEATFEINAHEDQSHSGAIKQEMSLLAETNVLYSEDPNEDDLITIECQSSLVVGVQVEPERNLEITGLGKPEEINLVKEVVEVRDNIERPEEYNLVKDVQEVVPPIGSQDDVKEVQPHCEIETKATPKYEVRSAKSNKPKLPQKISGASKEQNAAVRKKKPQSPMMKAPKVTTPRQLRPSASTTPIASSLKSLSKPGVSPSPAKGKNLAKGEKKNAVPKALHMSIALGSTNSHPASPATRKSFIMERMGDKDIVKRAFKMFQHNYVGLKLSGEESEQVLSGEEEPKASIPLIKQKESGGPLKAGSGARKASHPASSSYGSRSDERAGKVTEVPLFMKKLKERSTAVDKGKPQYPTKLKEEKKAGHKNSIPGLTRGGTSISGQPRHSKLTNGLKKVVDKAEV
ncbi:protein WVD2-like 7 isoform X2 [Rhodamnia argentea]|uniref:Protein WVD2-like 7 isoform X2 n=1 Tax=Rhodamnia argentea TaxID=178133 RepID=A0ABM3HH75_9MYRT|nr:protein WVD2-like 7 isoform X2 [Rhodamnia argentea]